MSETPPRRLLDRDECEQIRELLLRGGPIAADAEYYVIHKAVTILALLDTVDDLRQALDLAQRDVDRVATAYEVLLHKAARPSEAERISLDAQREGLP